MLFRSDQLIANPEGVVPKEAADRELFSLLSDFYLNPNKNNESTLELSSVEKDLNEIFSI